MNGPFLKFATWTKRMEDPSFKGVEQMSIYIKKDYSATYTRDYQIDFLHGYVIISQSDTRNGYQRDAIQINKEDWASFVELINKADKRLAEISKEAE